MAFCNAAGLQIFAARALDVERHAGNRQDQPQTTETRIRKTGTATLLAGVAPNVRHAPPHKRPDQSASSYTSARTQS